MEKLNAIGDWEKVHKVACGEGFEWPAQSPEVPFLNQPNVMSIMFVALSVATIVGALIILGFFAKYLWKKCRQTNLVDPTEPIPMSFRPTRQPYPSIDSPIYVPQAPNVPSAPAKSCLKGSPNARGRYWAKRPETLSLYIPPSNLSITGPAVFEPWTSTDSNPVSTPPGPYTSPTSDRGELMVGPFRGLGPINPGSAKTGNGKDYFCGRYRVLIFLISGESTFYRRE